MCLKDADDKMKMCKFPELLLHITSQGLNGWESIWFIGNTADLLNNIFLHLWRNSPILLVFNTINSTQPLKPWHRAALRNLQTKDMFINWGNIVSKLDETKPNKTKFRPTNIIFIYLFPS